MRAEFTSDNRGFPHGGFPSITPRWPNGSEERYSFNWLTERSKRGECQKYVLCLLARQRFQDEVTCLSFQTVLSLKTEPLKLAATVAYLDILYSVGLRAT
jgi:hypothetical protein